MDKCEISGYNPVYLEKMTDPSKIMDPRYKKYFVYIYV